MRITFGGLLALMAWSIAAAAAPEDTVSLKVFSPMFAGLTGGIFCDYEIDRAAMSRYLVGQLGKDTKFSIDEVVFIVWSQMAQQAMQASLGALPKTPNERKTYCATILKSFGSTGTTIPGIVKP
jgi:hypothetical protein